MLKTKAIPAVIAGALLLAPTLALADEHGDRTEVTGASSSPGS
jgi:hypothetical protein